MAPVRFERRYGITSGFYPTATKKGGAPRWGSKAASGGILRVAGLDFDGKPNFSRQYPIKGSRVWYQFSSTLKSAENAFSKQVSDMENLMNSTEGANSIFLQAALRQTGGMGSIGPAMIEHFNRSQGRITGSPRLSGRQLFDGRRKRSVNKDRTNPVVETLSKMFEEYRGKASLYSQQLQREVIGLINETSSNFGKQFKFDSKRTLKTLNLREKAHRSRAAAEEQMSPEEGPEGIGATQPMDAFIKIGNRVVGVDVTEELAIKSSEQSREYHHSLTGGALMDEAEYLVSSDLDVRKKMKKYYNEEIQQRWNPSIAAMRKQAQETTGKKQVTAEEIRNPTGGMHPAGRGGKAASLPVRQGLRFGRSLSGQMSKEQRKSVISHLFHWIGNWSANSAGAFDTFALQHKPIHRTASIFLRNYAASNRSRAFEFKNVRLKDALIHEGPALYNLGRMNNYYANRTAAQFKGDATTRQLASQIFGNKGVKAVVNGSNLAINGRARPKVAIDLFIPDVDYADLAEYVAINMGSEAADNYFHYFHDQMSSRLQNPTRSPSHFNNYMNNYGKSLAKELGAFDPDYRFWASAFYGTEFVGDTSSTRTRQEYRA